MGNENNNDINMERDEREDLLVLFHRVSILIHKAQRKSTDGLELQRGQGRLLRILYEEDGISQKELAKRLRIKAGSLSELVSKLEEKGHIKRIVDNKDKRKQNIHISESGIDIAEQMFLAREEISHQIFNILDEREEEEFYRILEKLLKHLREEEI